MTYKPNQLQDDLIVDKVWHDQERANEEYWACLFIALPDDAIATAGPAGMGVSFVELGKGELLVRTEAGLAALPVPQEPSMLVMQGNTPTFRSLEATLARSGAGRRRLRV